MTRPVATPGRLVAGRYRLLSELGGGGMGTVWLSRDELLGRQVAVKYVLPPLTADRREAERQRERALREGRIAARLSNPHAISMYDVAVERDQPWLVMEYMPSRSLAEVLAEDGLLPVDQVAQIGAQVADALAATHAAGIVHRDVKPANILIGEGDRVQGLVKITDFGISHAAGDVTLTQTGQITGTPAFLAPEVAQGEEPQPPSDVFSLGATLYTCLEGEPPFGMGENALQLLHRVAGGDVTPPSRAGSMIRPLMRMLAADPAGRPTMEQVRDELAKLAAGRDGDPTTVLMARTRLGRSPGRQRTATLPPMPAVVPAAIAPEEPVEEPPAREEPAGPVTTGGERRRRRPGLLPLAVGALLVLALAGVGVVLALTSGTDRSGTSAHGTSAPGTSAAHTGQVAGGTSATGSPSPGSPSSGASSPGASSHGPTSPPAAGGPVTAKNVRDFLQRYHSLLPADPQAAWALTGPDLRNATSEDGYVAFWRQFSDVQLSNVQAKDGSLVATGTLEYRWRDGRRQTERHQFTLVRGDHGQLLMDRDVQSG